MPGHVKKLTGPDPDPSPWLAVSPELKIKNKAKPYDPKKSVWVPNKAEGGYLEGMLESTDGAKVSVNVGGEVKVFKEDQVCQVNHSKFDCAENMADLTFLGDACFLSKMSSYTATVGSCASQSIPTSGSQFTPFKPWNSMLVRGAVNARPISLPLLKEHLQMKGSSNSVYFHILLLNTRPATVTIPY